MKSFSNSLFTLFISPGIITVSRLIHVELLEFQLIFLETFYSLLPNINHPTLYTGLNILLKLLLLKKDMTHKLKNHYKLWYHRHTRDIKS